MNKKLSILPIICVLILLLAIGETNAQPEKNNYKPNIAPVSTLSRISVEGNIFVDQNGKTLVFRGINIADPDKLEKEGKWNPDIFVELKKWGANIVRFPVHPRAWRERGVKEYLGLLDRGIEIADSLGLYVIMDWHSIGNLKSGVFQSVGYDTSIPETLNFWKIIASRYGKNTTVAFYELFNEPTTGSGRFGLCTWNELKAIYEEAIVIIRANGGKGVPLVAGFNWAYSLQEIADNPVNAEGIGYVSHPYPQKREKPWEDKWTSDWGYVSDKYPLILTEIGFCGADDPGAHIPVISDESYGDAITGYCKKRGISYVVWVFDPNWSPMLISDWDYTPTRFGKYFKKALQKN